MKKGWKQITIGDLGQVVTGNTPPKKDPKNYGGEYPFIKPTDMNIGERHVIEWEENYSQKAFDRYHRSYIPPGATGVVTIGTVGEKMFQADRYCFTNQSVNVVIPSDKYEEDFVYYLLKISLPKVENANPGTASGRHHVSKTNFCAIKVKVPEDKITQQKIASILSAYDDLIENNLKRIKLLEEKAQITFKLLFQKENDNWRSCNLGQIVGYDIGGGWGKELEEQGYEKPAYVIRGTDIDDLPSGKIENVPLRWHKKSNLKSRKLKHGDIVFEVSGGSSTAGVAKSLLITESLLGQFDQPVMSASFCKLMRPEKVQYAHLLYLFLQYLRRNRITEIFEKRSASNIVNYNWTAFLEYQKIKVPDATTLEKFNKEIEAIYKLIYNTGKQNQLLKEARDILLPRLMTGMIDPSEISGQVVEKLDLEESKEQPLGMVAKDELNYSREK